MDDEGWIHRCLELARNGAGQVAPNPMVGALLVQGDHVLAEGWHRAFGGPHAEVECLRSFGNGSIPPNAVMYVNIEPCSHQGKTPPCVDLLIARGVKNLVVGCEDPNPLVKGEGIARAREAGIDVITDVMRDECRWLNRRFISSMEKQRPYIILKWARSVDGFLDDHGKPARISSTASDVLVHRWRSEEQAILVGSRTVVNDDPQLTVRLVNGKNPLRVVIDRKNTSRASSRIFDGTAPTLLVSRSDPKVTNADVLLIGDRDPIDALLAALHQRDIRSLLVEGGAELLSHFISRGLWNEARVITGSRALKNGTRAPELGMSSTRSLTSSSDSVDLFVNGSAPEATWYW